MQMSPDSLPELPKRWRESKRVRERDGMKGRERRIGWEALYYHWSLHL